MKASLRSTSLFAAIAASALAIACSDEATTPDAGMGNADATGFPDATPFVLPDAGNPDAQPARDATVMDAGPACIMNGAVDVDGTSVMVGDTTEPPKNPNDTASILTCRPPRNPISASIRLRGCITVLGAAPTQAELDALEIAAFHAVDIDTQMPIDPTYDPATGADRAPASARMRPSILIQASSPNCGGGPELVLGRDSVVPNAFSTDAEYIIRTKSSSTAPGGPVWVDQYHYGVLVGSDQLDMGRDPAFCNNATDCSGRVDFVLARRSAFAALGTAMGANVGDLSDHAGPGHAMVQVYDCQELPMQNATAGFSPAPAARSYVTEAFAHDGAATRTSKLGALVGLGFTGTSSTTTRSVSVGSAISTGGVCAEAYSGRTVPVHPDALSLVRVNRNTKLD